MAAAGKSGRRAAKDDRAALSRPVARVAVDVSLLHLDRPFDYLVGQSQDEAAVPGCRVRVRFAGKLVGGFLLERVESTEHEGRLSFLERVVSAEPVLSDEIARLARVVADRWAGSLADVVRLAVPPRHAAVETGPSATIASADAALPPQHGLARYDGGDAVLAALAEGGRPRLVWQVLPGPWPDEVATVAAATLAAGRGVVVVVPDHRDVDRVDAALTRALGPGRHVALAAGLGPAERYRRFLAVRRGSVRCVVGTRSAVWAPVADVGAVIVWDDGDDLHAEPRAPYCHARDVAVQRAHLAGASVVLAGHAVTAEGAALVATGWATSLASTAPARRDAVPAVRATGDDDLVERDPHARAARLPSIGWQAARDALGANLPVLVQVPRRGYQPALACGSCRLPARCPVCAGPLARPGGGRAPVCRWCGVVAAEWRCPSCGAADLRAVVVGARRTAEELGRAFPGVTVRTSGGDDVVASVPSGRALVVATPGAEPVADGGYGAALLLDGWALLSRPDLRAGEESLRRWLNAASLVRPAPEGRVVVVAAAELRAVQALVRWQPSWYAERELADRAELHLPPAARMAAVTGEPAAVSELLALAELPDAAEVLGPVPAPATGDDGSPTERMLVRVPRRDGAELAERLRAAGAVRSARKAAGSVRVELDPVTIG